jgi:hypothetical protein
VIVGGHTEPSARCTGGRGDGFVREDDASGCPGRSARRNDQGVTRLDSLTDTHRSAQLATRLQWQTLIDGKRGVSSVPDAAQLVDERRSAGEVERNELL